LSKSRNIEIQKIIVKSIAIISFLLLSGLNGFGQVNSENWTEFTVENARIDWKTFYETYTIKKTESDFYIFNDSLQVDKKVVDSLVSKLLFSLENKFNNQDPLLMFGKDSVWVKQNANKILEEYKQEYGEEVIPNYDDIAISTIKDYSLWKQRIKYLTGKSNNRLSPTVKIQFKTSNDSLTIKSNGNRSFMLPWDVNGEKLYNSKISESIAPFVDYEGWPNQQILKGNWFNVDLMDNLYNGIIRDKISLQKSLAKYPKQFNKLKKHFVIHSADMPQMGSIEFGGKMGRNCLEIGLRDYTTSKNIRFTPVFGRRILLHSVNPLLKSKDKIIKQLETNPIYQYAISTTATLDIHFVNKKSLSNAAKRNFKKDVKKASLNSKIFNGKFKDAIFISLRERRNEEGSSSRWIILKDGTNILWDFNGKFLLNLPNEYTSEKGFVCKVIPNEKLK
tara:strand:- start:1215 stop:2558 length:1344 start_codon:yes stop_codon:yes gene_type:complete